MGVQMALGSRYFRPWLALVLSAACAAQTASPSPSQPPAPSTAVPATLAPSTSFSTSTPTVTFTAAPPTPSPAPTATATAAPSPTAGANTLEIEWRLARGDGGFGQPYDTSYSPSFRSGVVFQNRFFVAGEQDDGEYNEVPYVWSSSDGLSWNSVRLADQGHVNGLVKGPAGLVAAVGAERFSYDAALWFSSDGQAWEPVTDADFGAESAISYIGASPDGYVAFGSSQWTSADGRDWQAVTTPSSSTLVEAGVQGVVTSGATLLAIAGGPRTSGGGPLQVWLSTNLTDWTNVGSLSHSAIMDSPEVAAGPLGWIVWDSNDRYERIDRMWLSPDGQTWEEVAQAPGPVSDIFVDSVGFIAVGFLVTSQGCVLNPAEIQGLTWTSPDGRTWTEMARDGFQFSRIDHLFRNNRTLIGLGVSYSGEDDETALGSVWTAKLPQIPPAGPGPSPAPTATEEPNPGCG